MHKVLMAVFNQHSCDKIDAVYATVHQMVLEDVTPADPIRLPTFFGLHR